MSKWINKANLQKIIKLKGRYTLRELCFKILEKRQAPYRDYADTYQQYLPAQEEQNRQRNSSGFQGPRISIVVPAYETDQTFFRQTVDSVVSQTYSNWQLCIADGSRGDQVEQVVRSRYAGEKRITYQRLKKNGGISENTNAGFELAKGDYIGLLDHDDILVETALFEMVKRIQETDADFLYSDEDKVSGDLSSYQDPHFKPDFNPELLRGNNYICHFLVFSRDLLEMAGGMKKEFDGAQDFDFVLRCSEAARRIEHIPHILYHWRIHPGSTAGNAQSKLYAYEAGIRAVEAHLERMGWQGRVSMLKDYGFYRTVYEPPRGIKVKLFLWGAECSGFARVLQQLQQELKQLQCRIVPEGAEDSDYILLVNRGLNRITPGSAGILLGSCGRKGVAVVGGRTVAKGRVLQCGYQKRESGYEPLERGLPKSFKGYFRHAVLARNTDAVTNVLAVIKTEYLIPRMRFQGDSMRYWAQVCADCAARGQQIVIEPQAEGSLTK